MMAIQWPLERWKRKIYVETGSNGNFKREVSFDGDLIGAGLTNNFEVEIEFIANYSYIKFGLN